MKPAKTACRPRLEIHANGAHAAAPHAARAEILAFLGLLAPKHTERLSHYRLVLDILPWGVSLQQIPGYRSRPLDTTAGYQPQEIRAIAIFPRGRTIRLAIGEERFLYSPEYAGPNSCLPRNSIAHEMGHAVQYVALSMAQICLIQDLYMARLVGRRAWLDDYAKTDWHEYFAESVTAYLGYPQSPHQGRYTRQWLARHDPEMLGLLASVFPRIPPPPAGQAACRPGARHHQVVATPHGIAT
jgi:hypothetical protein